MTRQSDRASEWLLVIVAVFGLATATLLGKAYESTLPTSDAAVHADLALSATGQGIVPHFPIGADEYGGHWGKGFNDYPFPLYWLSGWSQRWLGPDAWSYKLLPCLFAVFAVMLTLALGAHWQSRLAGVLASLVFLFNREFIQDVTNAHLDGVLACFILGSVLLWERDRPWAAAICAGIGTWVKSPVALLVFPVMAAMALLTPAGSSENTKAPRFSWRRWCGALSLAMAVGFLAWIPPWIYGGWGLVSDYWVRQVWGTAIEGRHEQNLELFAIFRIMAGHYLPWTFLLIWGLVDSFRPKNWPGLKGNRAILVPALAAGILIALISCVRYKHDHYFVPAYPFLSIIAVRPLAVLLGNAEDKIYAWLPAAVIILLTVLVASPIELSPESFPALRKFMAIIQSYGTCADKVLFVDGGQPYGSVRDYRHLVNYYTSRQMLDSDCAGATAQASLPEVKWIVLSAENAQHCLDAAVRARFQHGFTYGRQILLADGVPEDAPLGKNVDLTPLARELRVATDCKAAPLPKDRYQPF